MAGGRIVGLLRVGGGVEGLLGLAREGERGCWDAIMLRWGGDAVSVR